MWSARGVMWNLKALVQICTVAILMSGLILIVYQVYQWERAEEAELIAAGGKFPGEQITDRWKKLMEGCE